MNTGIATLIAAKSRDTNKLHHSQNFAFRNISGHRPETFTVQFKITEAQFAKIKGNRMDNNCKQLYEGHQVGRMNGK